MRLTTAMSVSKKTIVIAGLPVHIYSARQWTERTGPAAVLFFLHGRTGTAKGIEWIAEDTLKHVEEQKKKEEMKGRTYLKAVTKFLLGTNTTTLWTYTSIENLLLRQNSNNYH